MGHILASRQENGTIGEIHRHGQSKNSSCCGAAKGALNKLINNLIIEGNITDMDYQMNTIEQILLNKKKGFCQPLFRSKRQPK